METSPTSPSMMFGTIGQQEPSALSLPPPAVAAPPPAARDFGVFWDHENVRVPRWCDARRACNSIRDVILRHGRIVEVSVGLWRPHAPAADVTMSPRSIFVNDRLTEPPASLPALFHTDE
jgi:hypothetical protein